MSTILTNHGFLVELNLTSTRTQSLTLSAGTGRKLVICTINQSDTKTTTAATFDGEIMSRIGSLVSFSGLAQDWFYYDIPDAKSAAAYNVSLTFSGSTVEHNTLIAWTTAGNAAGVPVLSFGTQASGTATVFGSINAISGDALLSVATRTTTSGTSWSSCTSSQVTFGSTTDTSAGGRRIGRSHAIGDATEAVTATWTTNSSTDALLMSIVNTTPSASGPTPTPAFGRYGVRSPAR